MPRVLSSLESEEGKYVMTKKHSLLLPQELIIESQVPKKTGQYFLHKNGKKGTPGEKETEAETN